MLIGRCSRELSGRKLQRKVKKLQTPTIAEWRDLLAFPYFDSFFSNVFSGGTPLVYGHTFLVPTMAWYPFFPCSIACIISENCYREDMTTVFPKYTTKFKPIVF